MNVLDIILAKKLTIKQTQPTMDRADQAAAEAKQLAQQANETLSTTQEKLDTLAETVDTANQAVSDAAAAVEQVTTIEEQAVAAAEKAQAAADSFDEMKSDLLTAAEGLVDEAVVEVVNRELTTLNEHMDEVDQTVQGFQSTITEYDTRLQSTETEVESIKEQNESINTQLSDVSSQIASLEENAIDVTIEDASDTTANIQEVTITKGKTKKSHKIKNYKKVSTNEDGGLTPKAAKEYVDEAKAYLEQKIKEIKPNGGISNLGSENAGKAVIVGEDGNITAGSITEEELVKMANALGIYQSNDLVGIEIDYENKVCARIQGSISLTPGAAFDKFKMYGGRKRCVVNNTGKIVAFEGENNYVEDGSAGQVMVYQPKVYYMRNVLSTTTSGGGTSITKEQILLSDKKIAGFKLHPLFLNEKGEELDYVLLPAYEACVYDIDAENYIKNDDIESIDYDTDMLSSIGEVKPASSISLTNYKKMAQNRGERWTLTNIKAESLNQLLMVVEYGTFNLQGALGRGICDLTNSTSKNIALLTGSTSKLGSKSGAALSSKDENETSYTENGKIAVSYRGYENPYGNIWRYVDGITFVGNRNNYGGTVTIDGAATTSTIPNTSDWFSCFSYDAAYDWLMMPGRARFSPNSSLPVGDYYYVTPNLDHTNECLVGGKASSQDIAGPFTYYAAAEAGRAEKSFNARIMYVPTHNSIYTTNCEKWNKFIGG